MINEMENYGFIELENIFYSIFNTTTFDFKYNYNEF